MTKVRKTTTDKGKKGSTWQGCYTEKSKAKPKAKPKKPKRHPEWGGEGKPSREQYLQFLQDKKSKWHLSKYKHYTTGITGTHWPESPIAVFHEEELKKRKGTQSFGLGHGYDKAYATATPVPIRDMRYAGYGAGPTAPEDRERLWLQHQHPVGTEIRIENDPMTGPYTGGLEKGEQVMITGHTEKGFEVKPHFGPPRVIDPHYYRGLYRQVGTFVQNPMQKYWEEAKGYDPL